MHWFKHNDMADLEAVLARVDREEKKARCGIAPHFASHLLVLKASGYVRGCERTRTCRRALVQAQRHDRPDGWVWGLGRVGWGGVGWGGGGMADLEAVLARVDREEKKARCARV